MATATAEKNIGRVTQVIGSTFDAEYPEDKLPPIYNAVKIVSDQKGVRLDLTGEVQQHLGGGRVRCVALGSTDGMVRGMACIDTGSPVSVPVGEATLGRVFNLLGEPVDERGPVKATEYWPIHREAPKVNELSTRIAKALQHRQRVHERLQRTEVPEAVQAIFDSYERHPTNRTPLGQPPDRVRLAVNAVEAFLAAVRPEGVIVEGLIADRVKEVRSLCRRIPLIEEDKRLGRLGRAQNQSHGSTALQVFRPGQMMP